MKSSISKILVPAGLLAAGYVTLYAAFSTDMGPTVGSGSVLSSAHWNTVVSNVSDLHSRLTSADSRVTALEGKIGSTYIHWGRGTPPSGITQLYSGWGYGAYYGHYGGSQPVCLQGGDPGGSAAGVPNADLIYPMGTGDAGRLPPGISAERQIRCVKAYAPGHTTEIYGSQNCPTGWAKIYQGYMMGEYYNHYSGKGIPICVDSDNFDTSRYWNWASGGTYMVGSYLGATSDSTNYPATRWVKCAVCGKY